MPRDTRYAVRVDTGTAAFFKGYTPASLEAAVIEFATATERVVAPKGLVPPSLMTPEQLRRYGMDFKLGPDPLRSDGRWGLCVWHLSEGPHPGGDRCGA